MEDKTIVQPIPVNTTPGDYSNNADSASREVPSKEHAIPVIRNIERHAEISPEKVAVSYNENQFTYAQIMATARKVAVGLEELGARPGSRVVVLMHPCTDLVCSILGIHMLGATYVPIDPGFPTARISMILEDVVPVTAICSNADLAQFTDRFTPKIAGLLNRYSDVLSVNEQAIKRFSAFRVSLDHESHIFFTSGTTGRPKGAISSHRNLAHGMSSSSQCFGLNDEHSILSIAGSSFSISTFELLSMLSCGGCTVIAQRSDILDIRKLFNKAKTVSVWHFVPTLLARLIEFIEQDIKRINQLNRLARILTGGDNVPPELLRKVRKLLPDVELFVNYGASETNCMVTYWPVVDSDFVKTKIGIPQNNVKLLVLDKNKQIVEPGQIGELLVSSPGVIPGYLHREDLNKIKFIHHNGVRYFATGDIVRVDDNGLYEMLGREDFQVQLNGNRIELLEVESALKRAPKIEDCIVAASEIENGSDSLTLVAYIVCETRGRPSVDEIRQVASKYLPEYMIPSLYLIVDQIPTNHNGKVDRVNLPTPNECQILQSCPQADLSNPTEKKVAAIWARFLPARNIHANSDFFELGGDSISAVRAVSALSEELNCSISIADIVNNSRLRALALLIDQDGNQQSSDPAIDSNSTFSCLQLREGNTSLSPLILINGVVEYLELAKALRTDRPLFATYLPEEIDIIVNGAQSSATESTSSIERITQLYLSIITKLQPDGPYYLAGKSFGGIIAIQVGLELEKLGHQVAFIGLLDTVVPDAFVAHKRLAFRMREHIRRTCVEGPGYILERVRNRFLRRVNKNDTACTERKQPSIEYSNLKTRQKVRKSAIYNTKLDRIKRPLVLIKAKDRKYLYGEKPSSDLGWSHYCTDLTIYEVPGEHHSILMAGKVDKVARRLEAHI